MGTEMTTNVQEQCSYHRADKQTCCAEDKKVHDSGIFRCQGLERGSLQQAGDYTRHRPNTNLR